MDWPGLKTESVYAIVKFFRDMSLSCLGLMAALIVSLMLNLNLESLIYPELKF